MFSVELFPKNDVDIAGWGLKASEAEVELGTVAEKMPFALDGVPFMPLVALEVSVLKLLKMELAGDCEFVAPNLNPVEAAGLFMAEFTLNVHQLIIVNLSFQISSKNTFNSNCMIHN